MAFKRFPQDQRTKVSPTALRMWKWVNRLPSRPSLCFHWSPSSWLIIERMCVNITSWTFGQRGDTFSSIHICTTFALAHVRQHCQIVRSHSRLKIHNYACGFVDTLPDLTFVMSCECFSLIYFSSSSSIWKNMNDKLRNPNLTPKKGMRWWPVGEKAAP